MTPVPAVTAFVPAAATMTFVPAVTTVVLPAATVVTLVPTIMTFVPAIMIFVPATSARVRRGAGMPGAEVALGGHAVVLLPGGREQERRRRGIELDLDRAGREGRAMAWERHLGPEQIHGSARLRAHRRAHDEEVGLGRGPGDPPPTAVDRSLDIPPWRGGTWCTDEQDARPCPRPPNEP
ncbi:hypothetical protein [Actinotalea ferrariae]|uniref:hypothetical protein n=1 Tax=Actinotalea ferrariae TaxID=1386098 RepID=UPI0012DC75E6|nr:hypothetical protein [Actinotalea ferrariae]